MTTNKYWLFLEKLRRSGVTNMYAASDWLIQEFLISTKEANQILTDWMTNYNPKDYE